MSIGVVVDNLKILKSLGQNFLTDKNIINKVIEAGEIKPDDVVFEVGPGKGALTFELAKYAGKVVAIEKDKGLAKELDEMVKLQRLDNVEIIHGDALKIFCCRDAINRVSTTKYKIISNPPYEIAARLLIDFLISGSAGWRTPERIVFVIQKEIAQRVISKPNDMNILAVITQAFGNPKIIANVPRGCFYPQPRVDSAILRIDLKLQNDIADKTKFVQIVKAGFSAKRKFLLNNLADKLSLNKNELKSIFEKLELSEKIRAEELSVFIWKVLTKFLIN